MPVGAAGGQRRAHRLEAAQRDCDVLDPDLSGLEDQADHVGDLARLGGPHDRPAGVAPPDGEQPLGLEDAQRLPDRGEADAELLEQLLLLGEERPVAELVGEDPLPEPVGDQVGQPGLAQRGPTPAPGRLVALLARLRLHYLRL